MVIWFGAFRFVSAARVPPCSALPALPRSARFHLIEVLVAVASPSPSSTGMLPALGGRRKAALMANIGPSTTSIARVDDGGAPAFRRGQRCCLPHAMSWGGAGSRTVGVRGRGRSEWEGKSVRCDFGPIRVACFPKEPAGSPLHDGEKGAEACPKDLAERGSRKGPADYKRTEHQDRELALDRRVHGYGFGSVVSIPPTSKFKLGAMPSGNQHAHVGGASETQTSSLRYDVSDSRFETSPSATDVRGARTRRRT